MECPLTLEDIMDTPKVVNGDNTCGLKAHTRGRAAVLRSVQQAIQAGFEIGRSVRLGQVEGHVVGYNIARCGSYVGDHYPLLVRTDFGIAKCRLSEVALD